MMSHEHHFKHADDLSVHLRQVISGVSDPLIAANYVGFFSIAAVTAYELAIKDLFISFAQKKHPVFGSYTSAHFDRINGKIKIRTIKEDYLRKLGARYLSRFGTLLEKESRKVMREERRDVASAYNNLIVWRNEYAHEGRVNSTATFNETLQAYEDGKVVVGCLARALVR